MKCAPILRLPNLGFLVNKPQHRYTTLKFLQTAVPAGVAVWGLCTGLGKFLCPACRGSSGSITGAKEAASLPDRQAGWQYKTWNGAQGVVRSAVAHVLWQGRHVDAAWPAGKALCGCQQGRHVCVDASREGIVCGCQQGRHACVDASREGIVCGCQQGGHACVDASREGVCGVYMPSQQCGCKVESLQKCEA
eukprot:1014903-Pelagomonas_calceolata.AAC.7